MEEYIGKVKLNTDYYSGKDLYSDGPIEDKCLEIAKNVPRNKWNEVIAEEKSWPILYHFSNIRENIVDYLPIKKEHSVLEIGSGCGAITGILSSMAGKVDCIELSKKRTLINAYRNRDRDNISIFIGNFQDIEKDLTEKYDYITLIGVFEYAISYIGGENPYVDMLKTISKHLKKDGKIIIAIENRLGLKYFAGAREDHLGTFFEGIEGYPNGGYVKTFSRKELIDIVNKSGNYKIDFYYPYPDYKFPMVIYSDYWLPKKGELKGNALNFDRDRIQLFSEENVLDSLVDADLFKELSNSFLVILQRED